MGCVTSKSKQQLEITKPIEKNTSVVTPLIEANRKPIERHATKHKNPLADTRLKLASTETEAKSAEIINKPKTQQEIDEICKSLSSHFLFNAISEENLTSLIDEIKLFVLGPKEIIFTQGSAAQNFYIISTGKVEVIVNGKRKKIAAKGEQFGELALLHDSLRTATVVTVEKSSFWVLSRESFRSQVQMISNKKHSENRQFIESIPIFQNFTNSQKEILLSLVVTHEFKDSQKIVIEGDPGNLLYIIKTGLVLCTKGGIEIRKLGPGDFFGEQALVYNTQRTATVSAIGKVTLLSLGSEDLKTAFGCHLQSIIYRNSQRIAIEKSKILKGLTRSQIELVIDKMEIASFKASQVVIGRGTQKNLKIYIVLKGSIKCGNKFLGIYSCVGDEEIQNNTIEVFEENWVADVDSDIAILVKEDLENTLGGPLSRIYSQNEVISVLRRVQLLRTLPLQKLEALVYALKIYEYNDGQVIFNENDIGDAFYIVKEGQVEVIKSGISIRMITRHDFFGERSIILNENRTATVIAREKAVCWSLSKKDFLTMIDEGIRKQLTKRMELQNEKIMLEDLTIVKLLGKGMFGNVFLAYNTITKVFYAIKTVQRSKISAFEIYDNLVLERKILLQVDHPLIIKLVKSFKDEKRIYFLMEFVQGMDLFDALRELGLLNNDSSRFYIACIMQIFEHLHERNIIYRDLKPENIMIDSEGYPKLIDFGTAKILQSRTFTMVGTPHYMAPEVIKGIGYGLAADIWSIGIILYEFVCGYVPFGEEEEDPYKIYSRVLEKNLKYPNYISSSRCKPIIEKMLENNPVMRGNIASLKENPWFAGVSWDGILGKQTKPPFVPKPDNLSIHLSKALKSNKSLAEIINQNEEIDNEKFENHRFKQAPLNWDEDF